MPLPDTKLRAGDRLLVKDAPERLKEFEQVLGATLYAGDQPVDEEYPLTAEDQQIAEVVVVQGSPLEGTTLRSYRFTDRFQLVTLAIQRPGTTVERSGPASRTSRSATATSCWSRVPAPGSASSSGAGSSWSSTPPPTFRTRPGRPAP
jgi:uncharacterized protein with PhoU and TrkA domain